MKRKVLYVLLTVCAMLLCLFGSTACGKGDTPKTPQKLSTPVVTLTENVAAWEADENADKFEISLDGNLSYVENTIVSKTLEDGQTLKVRAVGDGFSFLTSAWSNSVTYTASGENPPDTPENPDPTPDPTPDPDNPQPNPDPTPDPTPTKAPTYLGIKASSTEPSATDAPAEFALYSTRISLAEALKAYLQNSENALGETAPTESDYGVYSVNGGVVYVQIWLNNPDQNTILSLKLNGTKYQSGGALQSFFVEDGDSYLNCVYVAVTVPANTYKEIAYEVTEIEYVEGANINQNGKAVLIDEDNDTVKIGLPYAETMPTATLENGNATATTLSFTVNVTDGDGFAALTGGWLRVLLYNRNNEIIAQQKVSVGDNTVTFENLSADTYYNAVALIWCDSHDGNGVAAHTLGSQTHQTANVLTSQMQSEILQNAQTGKYYPVINVTAELGDASFTFTKIEVSDWGGEVYYTGDFDGEIKITENILNGKEYVVKIYYENSLGVEQSYTDYVHVDGLEHPWVLEPCLRYGLMDDAILGFDFGDNKSNFDNLTIKIFDERSKQYIAEDALYLLENPNSIETLQAQLNSMDRTNPDYFELGLRIQKLEQVQQYVDKYYASMTKQDWEAEKAKGIYTYEYVYGQDAEFFKGSNNKFYVVLDGYQSNRVDDNSWQYILSADFDMNDGEGVEEDRTIVDGWFDVKAALTENDYLFVASDDDYNELFTVDENNVVYLETKSRNNLGDESYRNLGYVNQIVFADGYDILHVLWTQDEPNHDIDEAAWLVAVKNALIAGEDVHSVFPLGEMQPITFDLDDVEIPATLVGNFDIRFTYKMYGKTYTQEHPYDWDGATVAYTVIGQLPKASITINTKPVEDYGAYEIVIPEQVENGRWNYYVLEVKDGDGNPVGAYNQDNRIDRLSVKYSIRIKLVADPYVDYYTEGEWSEWFVCERGKLYAPITFTQSYGVDGVTVEWNGVERAEKYVYVINNGEETETSGTSVSGLKNGDKVKIKAVPAAESIFAESVYSEFYTVIDTRRQLATPTNLRKGNKMIMWDAVDGATYYEIGFIRNGTPYSARVDYPEYHAIVGVTYCIRACNDDVENYKASEWSADFAYTVTLENPTFNQVRRERVYWNSVENAGGYNYKIGENGDVVDNGSMVYVALSEIPVGEKLYVQAYADGCENTAWVMIYHNVTKLATPEVAVSGGAASWSAIENAEGYLYKINDGEEQSTTGLSVSGLVGGDRIVVCATSTQNGYVNSEWSEERTQLYTMSAPVLDVSSFASEGTVSWGAVEGATDYEYELDGNASTFGETSVSNIEFEQSFKVRAVCDNGEYEQYGEWSELVVREDTRERLATPVIAYDPEIGLTVVANDSNVSCYEVMFGQDGLKIDHYPTGSGGTEVITQSFTFPSDENTVYVRAIPVDNLNYRESEWATVAINF